MPTEFVVPGANRVSAALDLARTVVRRAERLVVSSPVDGSLVGQYLNRLSDLLWAMARWARGRPTTCSPGARRDAALRGRASGRVRRRRPPTTTDSGDSA